MGIGGATRANFYEWVSILFFHQTLWIISRRSPPDKDALFLTLSRSNSAMNQLLLPSSVNLYDPMSWHRGSCELGNSAYTTRWRMKKQIASLSMSSLWVRRCAIESLSEEERSNYDYTL